jgi:hypothetical protein
MHPRVVRAVEYELVPRSQATRIGLTPDINVGTDVAVLRCVDDRGEKLTTFCDAQHMRTLVRSGQASEPGGMALSHQEFPIVLKGWIRDA